MMVDVGLGAGLAALAFWGFIAVVVVAFVWDGIRKREALHETVRRLIESGQPIDDELLEKLTLVSNSGDKRHDRDFQITGLWLLPVAVGLAVFGLILGSAYREALYPIVGAAALVGCLGIGALISARIARSWYEDSADLHR